ncbi:MULTISPECIES: hypothetical protein [Trinickia]|nr:hypothetical protein [Trinickia symbiotica]
MRTILNRLHHSRWCAAPVIATLLAGSAYAVGACPKFVELSSGTIFSVADLISDTGSPEAALREVRAALAETNAAGGCRRANDRNACEETLAVTRKAISALEECTAPHLPRQKVE